MQTMCLVNARQIGLASNGYAADHNGYMGYAGIHDPTDTSGTNVQQLQKNFPDLAAINWGTTTTPYVAPADFFLAMKYILPDRDYRDRVGSPVLTCPLARGVLDNIFYRYNGQRGNAECHYSFSLIIARYSASSSHFRTNVFGPYKYDEIIKPSRQIIMADASAYTANAGYNNPDGTKPVYALETWHHLSSPYGVGLIRGTVAAALTTSTSTTHGDGLGPSALHCDGHVRSMTGPSQAFENWQGAWNPSNVFLSYFTANSTPVPWGNTTWP